jgi:hypothetical protein
MRSTIIGMTLLALAAASVGCGPAARKPEVYRDDTQKVLDTKSAEIKGCYDGVLKTDGQAAGTVTVRFDVMQETGKLTNVRVDEAASTAPATVRECLTNALQGLVLKPGDGNPGKATFVWDFKSVPAPAPGPAAATGT